MAKSKKSKKKTQDFKRVKLKVGRKLKKTQETDTSFKAAKVVLLKQFSGSADSSAPVSHRKLTFEKLLEQIHHHNHNVRKDALSGLKEILSGHNELLLSKLPQLCHMVSSLITNDNVAVRKALIPVIKIMFSVASETEIMPHFSLLAASASCALMNMDSGVKRTGLLFLELLIQCYPYFACSCWTLMENCLCLLGTVQQKSDKVVSSSKLLPLERRETITRLALKLLSPVKKASDTESSTRQKFGPPFLTPVVSRIRVDNSDYLEDINKLTVICHRLLPFVHDLWLELICSDSAATSKQYFDASVLSSLNNILSIHTLLLSRCLACFEGNLSAEAEQLRLFLLRIFSDSIMRRYNCNVAYSTKPSSKQASEHKVITPVPVLNGHELCKLVHSNVAQLDNFVMQLKNMAKV